MQDGLHNDQASMLQRPASLLVAIDSGNIAVVKFLLDNGADPNETSETGQTALHIAVAIKNQELVQTFLAINPNNEIKDNDGNTVLHLAAKKGHYSIAQILIEASANVNSENERGCTPLHLAAEHGHTLIIKLLLDNGAKAGAKDLNDSTPLHFAARSGKIDDGMARILMASESEVMMKDKFGRTPLHNAYEYGHVRAGEVLLKHHADIDARDQSGRTPLYMACKSENWEMFYFLLSYGPCTAFLYKQKTLLHVAAQAGYGPAGETLIEKGAVVDAKCLKGQTPLMFAAMKGHHEVVKLLLDSGANINAIGGYSKESSLHTASENGHYEVVKLLLDSGANINATCGYWKESSLHKA